MGNIKNKRHHQNQCRHVFKRPTYKYGSRSRVPLREIQAHKVSNPQHPHASETQRQEQSRSLRQNTSQVESSTEQQSQQVMIEGSRIINIHKLQLLSIE